MYHELQACQSPRHLGAAGRTSLPLDAVQKNSPCGVVGKYRCRVFDAPGRLAAARGAERAEAGSRGRADGSPADRRKRHSNRPRAVADPGHGALEGLGVSWTCACP